MAANFITIAFLYFFFHNPDSLVCVSEDRNAVCTQEYSPVCALYSGDDCDSPTGYCLKTMSNSCAACADPSVAGQIITGECPYVPVQVCSQEHDLNSCADMEIEGTVCGITQQAQTQPTTTNPALTKTLYDNGCQACNAGDSTFYLGGDAFGQCLAVSTSTICSAADRNAQNCEVSALKACGYYTGDDCTEQVCRRTYDSYCFACADEAVMFFQNGDCSEIYPIGENGTDPDDGGDGDGAEEEIVEEEIQEEVIPEEEIQEEVVPEEEIQEEVQEEEADNGSSTGESGTWRKSGKRVTKVVRVSVPDTN